MTEKIMKKIFDQWVSSGDLPWYIGLSYYNAECHCTHYTFIPFNYIVRWWRLYVQGLRCDHLGSESGIDNIYHDKLRNLSIISSRDADLSESLDALEGMANKYLLSGDDRAAFNHMFAEEGALEVLIKHGRIEPDQGVPLKGGGE